VGQIYSDGVGQYYTGANSKAPQTVAACVTALKSTADPAINAECPSTADLWKAIYEWRIEAA